MAIHSGVQQNDTQTLPSGLKTRYLALALCSPALAPSVDKASLVIGLMACPATHTGANGRDNMEYFILVLGGGGGHIGEMLPAAQTGTCDLT